MRNRQILKRKVSFISKDADFISAELIGGAFSHLVWLHAVAALGQLLEAIQVSGLHNYFLKKDAKEIPALSR
jgi:predicted nuclease of predicted toxin-antitoxin system